MAGLVDFEDYLNTAVGAVALDIRKDRGAVGKASHVGAFLGQSGQRWDFQRPGLAVCDVEMKSIHLVP